jgi:hypothetical protein
MKVVLIPTLIVAVWVLLAGAMFAGYVRHAPDPKPRPTLFAPTQVVVAPSDAAVVPPQPTAVTPET